MLFFASLAFLRFEIASTLNLAPAKALKLGMFAGLLNDISAALALLAIAALWRTVFGASGRPIWTGLSAFLFVANLANTLYFRFFSTRLDWWVVVHHWRDLFTVSDSAGTLGVTPRVILAVASFGASVVLLWTHAPPSFAWPIRPLGRGRLIGVALAFEILLIAAAGQLKPIANKWDRTTSVILTDQILSVWVHTWFRIKTVDFEDNKYERRKALKEALPGAFAGGDNPAETLAAFRDWREPGTGDQPTAISHQPGTNGSSPASRLPPPAFPPRPSSFILRPSPTVPGGGAVRLVPTDPAWPLLSRVEIDKDAVGALRDYLGMPRDRPLNFMIFFWESLRTFELLHPELGPKIFPRLRAILDKHAILFTHGHSSSITAGQTVRGEFAAMCSQISNVGGAAEYVAHPGIRAFCLQSYFKENGYENLWISGFVKSFHNKFVFESLHGTDVFFDEAYFREKGISTRIGKWGLADKPVLEETLRLLEARQAAGRPFFAHFITISTHHPHSVIPEGPLPPDLAEATARKPDYQAYLSRLKYADDATANFLDLFFASPLAKDTVIVGLGDHGITTDTHLPLSDTQRRQSAFRIPIAIITAGMTRPARIENPVHQADVAPTIAAIAGLPGTVTWIGRNMLSGDGTPWLYQDGDAIYYRTRERLCQSPASKKGVFCVRPSRDPLFERSQSRVAEDPKETEFFRSVLRANREAVVLNRLAPP